MDDPVKSLTASDEVEDDEIGQWLVTYADMVTLLLTFFVLLVALANFDTRKYEAVVDSIQNTFGKLDAPRGDLGRLELTRTMPRSLDQLTGLEEEPLLEDIQQMIKRKNIEDSVRVTTQGNLVILEVKGQTMFDSGQAVLKNEALPLLDQIAGIVRSYPDYVLHVKGHTDPRPISSPKFETNWELSALRATAVLRYLISKGIAPKRMTATGYADTEPLVPNTSEENMAKNRRVEFVLEKKEIQQAR
ncbi:MAG: OmpA family protein [Desulfarculus sp.]|nr:OmpA family protein [Desulfarculus sp.]